MKIDITFRDLNATEAAAILQMGKANGAELALFLASPGAPTMAAAPAAVAAATGAPPPASGFPEDPQWAQRAMPGPTGPNNGSPAAAPPAPPAREAGADDGPAASDLEEYSRYPTTRAVVKALYEKGITSEADLLKKCLELRASGVTPLKAVPEDQFPTRIGAALIALTG